MTTGRRRFLGSSLAAAVPGRAASGRPNLLYIMTDQQHWNMMSCAGNRWVKTPAMDSLAASGVRFDLAYSANPVCMPARTSMMTGRFPSWFGYRNNGPGPIANFEPDNAMGNVFRRAGYRTVFGGKTHWPRPITAANIGFEYITADERDGLADTCAAFLRQKQEQPFLMVASFINPHDICYMAIDAHAKATKIPTPLPKSVIERQRVAEASRPPANTEQAEFFRRHCPPLAANHAPTSGEPAWLGRYGGFRGWARKNWTAEEWRLHRWAYCRLTERVDGEIGRVLEALRTSGLDKNTVVVFASDHGDMDSAHGFEHKSLPFDESARVPFIVSWPGNTPAGRVDRKHFVSSCVDLLPTLCDYAGIDSPAGLPGRSVRPLVEKGAAPDWRQDIAIECSDSRCIRDSRYKYAIFESGEPRELLIDMRNDPGETRNLAATAKHAAVMGDFRVRMRRRSEEMRDEYGLGLAV